LIESQRHQQVYRVLLLVRSLGYLSEYEKQDINHPIPGSLG
jgi:hypothetical protein